MESFRPIYPPFAEVAEDNAYFLPIRDGELLVRASSSSVLLCQTWPKSLDRPPAFTLIGWLGERPCLLCELPPGKASSRTAGHAFRDLRSLHGLLGDAEYQAAGAAVAVLHFLRTSAYCSRCGAAAERDGERWLRRCPSCALEQEPRTHPTVMGLLHNGLQVLLVQPIGLGLDLYTLPATPVGPGQALEDAFRSYVEGTLGVRTGELCYYGSQPWPHPDRVVIAFHAAVDIQRPVPFDKHHYLAARWFHIDDLPAMPAPLSMARRLTDWYAQLPRVQGRPSIPRH